MSKAYDALPSGSRVARAVAVRSSTCGSAARPTADWLRCRARAAPRASSPYAVSSCTGRPRRARATATFAALPPACSTVEPSRRSTMSTRDSPTTSTPVMVPTLSHGGPGCTLSAMTTTLAEAPPATSTPRRQPSCCLPSSPGDPGGLGWPTTAGATSPAPGARLRLALRPGTMVAGQPHHRGAGLPARTPWRSWSGGAPPAPGRRGVDRGGRRWLPVGPLRGVLELRLGQRRRELDLRHGVHLGQPAGARPPWSRSPGASRAGGAGSGWWGSSSLRDSPRSSTSSASTRRWWQVHVLADQHSYRWLVQDLVFLAPAIAAAVTCWRLDAATP